MESQHPPSAGNESRQGALIIVAVVWCVISCSVIALRLGVRASIVRNIGWDDYTIIAAGVGEIIGTALVLIEVHYGMGTHRYYVSGSNYIEYLKYAYFEWIQTFQTLMLTKVSICCFLLRIPVQRRFIRPIQGAIVFLVVSNIALTLVWIVQCTPNISNAWHPDRKGSYCFSKGQLQRIIFSQAMISILSDFALSLFPIAILWNVQISRSRKIGLCLLMALGIITAACSIVRTITNWQNVHSDATWVVIPNFMWRSTEVGTGILAACIPALLPGYRVLSTGIRAYLTNRSKSDRTTEMQLIKTDDPSQVVERNTNGNHSHGNAASSVPPQARIKTRTPGLQAAADAAAAEADLAKEQGPYPDFKLHGLPGDKQPMGEGIKKVTTFAVNKQSGESVGASETRRSVEERDLERGQTGKERTFV